ncbi:MAG: hypothetical protein FJZ01_26640 [Candidatus Sericytochromatia bacterium]|nr:hypothetical protein [Candidatus Tanganyikabacteria bacterium]
MSSNLRPQVPARRRDAIEEYQQAATDKSDADRRKEVRKRKRGAVRACPECHAFSQRKRWRYDPDVFATLGEIESTLCPGCKRLADKRVDGYVELRGASLGKRAEEVRNLIDHVVAEARRNDPVHRLASFVILDERIVLETTSAWLAETIGKAVARRFHGELRLRFTPGEDFVRVYWLES